MPKPTQSKRDKYLLKRYGITDAEYQTMLAEQNGKCKICGKEPTGRPLHLDHDHLTVKLKVFSRKEGKEGEEWIAWSCVTHGNFVGRTKSEAIKVVKLELLRLSCRKLLCWHCNTTLKWARDNPEILRNAAKYLEDYQQQLTQGGQSARQA